MTDHTDARTDARIVLFLAAVLLAFAAWVATLQPSARMIRPAIAPGVTAVPYVNTQESP